MSASEDFCGCGDYACGECFPAGRPADAVTDNAWLDATLAGGAPPATQTTDTETTDA
jgi:hypothetical protein